MRRNKPILVSFAALATFVGAMSMSATLMASASTAIDEETRVPEIEGQSLEVIPPTDILTERAEYEVVIYDIVSWPVTAPGDRTSGYGYRGYVCDGCDLFHKAQDFTPGAGTPVLAVAEGVVVQAGWYGTHGNRVTIESQVNGNTVKSVYAHMQEGSIAVSQGQTVTAGQHIGRVGSTGASTGAHLHFELWVNGAHRDPIPWLNSNVNIHLW